MKCIGALMACNTFVQLNTVFRHFVRSICSPFLDNSVQRSLNKLSSQSDVSLPPTPLKKYFMFIYTKFSTTFDDEESSLPLRFDEPGEGLRGQSLSRQYFHCIAKKVVESLNDTNDCGLEKNMFFCRDLVSQCHALIYSFY